MKLECFGITIEGMNALAPSKEQTSSADKVILAGISCIYYSDWLAGKIRDVCQVDVPWMHTCVSHKSHSTVTASEQSEHWHIGLRQAKDTLDATTQNFTYSAILPLSQHYRSDRNFYRQHLNHDFASVLNLAQNNLARGNIGAYVFTHKYVFAHAK